MKPTPSLIRAPKLRLVPSDEARHLKIKQKYHKLCKSSGTQNIDNLLDDWTTTYTEAKEQAPSKTCICGNIRCLADCYYLAPERRPTGWNANSVKQEKADFALRSDQDLGMGRPSASKRKDIEGKASSVQQSNSSSGGANTDASTSTLTSANLGSFCVKSTLSALTYPPHGS